jgi:hypothetical protein
MTLSGLSANKLFLECVLNQNHNEHQNRNAGILWFVYICIAIKEIYGGVTILELGEDSDSSAIVSYPDLGFVSAFKVSLCASVSSAIAL